MEKVVAPAKEPRRRALADGTCDPLGETAAADTVRREPLAAGTALGRGEPVGRYLVLGALGRGAMGVVYEAYDPELDRRVALKMIAAEPRAAFSDLKLRLLREAKALARLAHPNVVAVHDVGATAAGLYIAMELVRGTTLDEWIARERPRRQRIVDAFIAAGRGLAAAHKGGLVHRDFKPANVLVGDDGRIRVADFGLARSAVLSEPGDLTSAPEPAPARGVGSGSAQLTTDGAVVGTPLYMAPEQHFGQGVDARSDQFSFAVALYEALYGEHPFPAETYGALVEAMISGKMRPPPHRPDVHVRVRRALVRALAVDPEARFPSMEALLASLEPRPASRLWVVAGAVAIAAGVGGALLAGMTGSRADSPGPVCDGGAARVATIWGGDERHRIERAFRATGLPHGGDTAARVSAALDRYAADWSAMHRDTCEATNVRGEQSAAALDLKMSCLDRKLAEVGALVEVLAESPDPRAVNRAPDALARLTRLDLCADADALAQAVPPPDDPDVRRAIEALEAVEARAAALYEAGSYRDGLEVATELARDASPIDHAPLRAQVQFRLGVLQVQSGDPKSGEATLLEALSSASAARNDALVATIWAELLSAISFHNRRPEDALRLIPFAQAAANRLPPDSRARANILRKMAVVLSDGGKYQEADRFFELALELQERVAGPEHPDTAGILNDHAVSLLQRGQYLEAEKFLERSLAILRKTYGPRHPMTAQALNNLGIARQEQGLYREARLAYQEAFAIGEPILGPDHIESALFQNNIGFALVKEGRPKKGLPYLERALEILERSAGPEHPDVSYALNSLGAALVQLGRPGEARRRYQRALALREKAFGPDHSSLAVSLDGLGEVALSQGKARRARESLERALAIRTRSLGRDAPENANTLLALSRAHEKLGHPTVAVRLAQRARHLTRRTSE